MTYMCSRSHSTGRGLYSLSVSTKGDNDNEIWLLLILVSTNESHYLFI